MPVKQFQRLLALLIVAVYFGATVIQAAAMTPAPVAPMADGMMHQSDGSSDPMPCQGKKIPPCVSDFGCVFLVSLPALPTLGFSTATEWSVVAYGGTSPSLHGRSIKPALGPPIT